jgi:hypothetical protein
MDIQIPLFKHDPNIMRRPDANRSHPAVWVRELAVLRALKPGKDNVVRRIKLRLGLNILWAKPEDSSKPAQLNEPGISGHASGKTTFCRLLRHILGEKHFANELVTQAIRRNFNAGWVTGEVFVAGKLWLVCRPFATGPHPFAVQDCTLDEFFEGNPQRQKIDDYIEALNHATIDALPVKDFAYSGQPIQWLHLLQWLTRDQECRFSQLTDWRNEVLSVSDSPEVLPKDRHLLMRSIIGLLDDQERQEIERGARLNKAKENARLKSPIYREQAELDYQRLAEATGGNLPPLDDRLFVESVTNKLHQELTDTENLIKALDTDAELKELQDNRDKAMRATAAATEQLKGLDELIQSKNTDLAIHQLKEDKKQAADSVLNQLNSPAGYCRVPIAEAKAKGCNLAFDYPVDLPSRRIEREIEDEVPRLDREIKELSIRKERTEQRIAECGREERETQMTLIRYNTKLNEGKQRLIDKRLQLHNQVQLAIRARETWLKAEELASSIAKYETAINESREAQRILRTRQQQAVSNISALYEQLICAVLGNSVSGSIDLSGRSLVAKIDHNGDLSSGAIDTIKILALDLAALAASVIGYGSHPHFLLHDSPREADIDRLTYHRFFLWVKRLEQSFGNNQPCSFQYIITTTEPPPETLQTHPWLLKPVLNASKPEARLLGVDL